MTKTPETTRSFIDKSLGDWKAIRSSHSLAFQEVETINSNIYISEIKINSKDVEEILKKFNLKLQNPFAINITWEAKSDWNEDLEVKKDKTTLVFSQKDSCSGTILRNKGYAELIHSSSDYYIDIEGGLNITTEYSSNLSFERINFLSKNVRFRYSIIQSRSNDSIIQTSHSSEIRKLSI